MEPLRVYLAGNLHTDWRARLMSFLPGTERIVFLEPLRDGEPSQFTPRDLFLIRRCDVLLVFLEEWDDRKPCRHIGTSAEVGYAFALGKPIIVVNAWTYGVESFEFLERMALSVVKDRSSIYGGDPELRTGVLLKEAAGILKFMAA